jgi:hypothetical protein
MRSYAVFLLLLLIKYASRVLYSARLEWMGTPLPDPWKDLRVLAMLNHTSLFEPIYAAVAPNSLLWQIAAHGVVPIAQKTTDRRLVGRLFRFVAHQVVPITRERDHTWADVVDRVHDPKALVVILPEGRMKRRGGFDLEGQPMTIRGGIADILQAIPSGRMLLAYCGGLHHVHAPGDRFPRFFRKVHLCAEAVDIVAYRDSLIEVGGEEGFKGVVIRDLTRRRDEYCPADDPGPTPAGQRN